MAQIKLNKWDLYRKIIRHWLVCDHETSREQTEINISDDIIKLIFKFNQFILTFTSASVATSHDIVNHDEPNIIQFDTMYLRWIYVTFGTQNIIFEWVDDPVKPTYDEEIIISYHMNDTMDYIYPDETESYFKQDDTYIHFVKAFEDVDNLIIPAVSIKAGQAIKFEISSQKIMYHA
eukprot:410620_1